MNRYEKTQKLGLNLIEKRLGYHLTNNPNRLMDEIQYITIHNTDNSSVGADSDNHHRYLQNDGWGRRVSWHYTVDERQALQHFRDERALWHTGTAEGNDTSIGIEIAMDADKKGEPLMGEENYRKAIANAAKLTAMLLSEYNLTADKVKQHYDWSKKNCPSQIRMARYGITWDDFLAEVKKQYEVLHPVERVKAPEGKLFRVAVDSFQYRDNAEKLMEQLRQDGHNTFLVVIDDPRRK